MNFRLAKEIYGLTPWMMDIHSIPVMSSVLRDIKNGVKLENPDVKLNTPFLVDVSSETRIIKRTYQLRQDEDFDGVGVIMIDGPITKNGGESSMGMSQISSIMKSLSKDSRVKSFIVLTDSGGGSSSAVNIMVNTINEVKQDKPVFGLVDKGGMAASAAYGIISACDQVFCEDPMSIVGSVGTMVQFEGREANSKDPNGLKHIRLYATKSTRKNEGFEEALNKDNYKIIVNDLLNPINEEFIKTVSKNRPSIKDSDFDNGVTYFAKDVIGTYIDGIKSFDEVVELSLSSYKRKKENGSSSTSSKSSININNKKMTKAEFKTANPDAYKEIVAEGIASEKDRTGAWLAHVHTDAKSVVEGIESGENISQSQREAFFVKQNSKQTAQIIETESAEDFDTGESSQNLKKLTQKKQKTEIDQAFDFELN